MENQKPDYNINKKKTIGLLIKLFHIITLFVLFFYIVGPILEGFFTFNYMFLSLFSLLSFSVSLYLELKLQKAVIYNRIMDFTSGLLLVGSLWFIFTYGAAAIQKSYLGSAITGLAGIAGIFISMFISLKLKRKAFIVGAIVGGILPLLASGTCMLGVGLFN